MYKVVKDFTDLQDDNHVYHAGDAFPRMGHDVSEERINELASNINRLGEPLIVAERPIEAEPKPKKQTKPRKKKAE